MREKIRCARHVPGAWEMGYMRRQASLIKPQMLLMQSLGLIVLGILVLARPELISAVISTLLSAALLINAVLSILTLFTERSPAQGEARDEAEPQGLKQRACAMGRELMGFLREQKRWPLILNASLSLVLGALIGFFPSIVAGGFGMGFGLWALLTGFVQASYVYQLRSTGSRGWIRYLVIAVLSLLFGVTMLLHPISNVINVRVVAGVYLLLEGLCAFVEYLHAMLRWDMENSRFLMRVRIQPPVMLTSFLPVWLLDKFNRMLERNNTDHIYEKPAPDAPKADISNKRLTILFHLGRNVAMGYGHVDFALGDTVYSYGCYDDASNRVLGFYSDGTFMVTKLKPYLDYCRRWQKKTLVGFTMLLTVEQEKQVRRTLERTLADCVPWKPGERNSTDVGQSAHASQFIPIRYYKVVSGPFKIYSALKTNCVAMAEILVGQSGLKVLPSYGIITPGSYYAFMERQLKDPDSPVIRKTVYKIKGRQTAQEAVS